MPSIYPTFTQIIPNKFGVSFELHYLCNINEYGESEGTNG